MQKSTLIGLGAGAVALAALYYTIGRPWLARMRGQAASMQSVAKAARASAPVVLTTQKTSKGTTKVNRAADPVKEIVAQAARGDLDPTGLRFEGVFG